LELNLKEGKMKIRIHSIQLSDKSKAWNLTVDVDGYDEIDFHCPSEDAALALEETLRKNTVDFD
jgi:imidazoleglycerol phosphate dehydratase HisB